MIIPAPKRTSARLTGPMLDEALRLCLRQVLVRRDVAVCRWRLASVGRCAFSDSIDHPPPAMIRFAYESTHPGP